MEDEVKSITPCIAVESMGDGTVKLWFGAPNKPKQFAYMGEDASRKLRDFLNQFLEDDTQTT